jgi:hypothetical protein
MTAYRQEALRCALLIDHAEQATLRVLRETGLVPNASSILQRDVYGWFERVQRATYRVTARGKDDMARFSAAGTLPELAPAQEVRSNGGGSPRGSDRLPLPGRRPGA